MTLLVISQGSYYERRYPILNPDTGLPLDLTGWTARGQVREAVESAAALYEWSVAESNLQLLAGELVISVPAGDSSGWTWRRGRFDIELTDPSGKPGRVDSGSIQVDPETTR